MVIHSLGDYFDNRTLILLKGLGYPMNIVYGGKLQNYSRQLLVNVLVFVQTKHCM